MILLVKTRREAVRKILVVLTIAVGIVGLVVGLIHFLVPDITLDTIYGDPGNWGVV